MSRAIHLLHHSSLIVGAVVNFSCTETALSRTDGRKKEVQGKEKFHRGSLPGVKAAGALS
jgi:hypothetical protein